MSLGGLVQSVLKNKAKSGPVANIIEFVESSWGLKLKMFPVQRVILKAYYSLPLDDKEEFELHDWRGEVFGKFTEASYLKYLYDQGRCNIPSVEPGADRTELVLAVGRRSGKCILGDSLVLTDKGIYKIEELGDPNGPEVQDLVIGVAQEGSSKSYSKYFYNGGVKAIRKLKTYSGFELGGTDNHRIKILDTEGEIVWRYLADLKIGDVVCLHRNTDLWSSEYVNCKPYHNKLGLKDLTFPEILDERWGSLLGYLVGDGLWNYRDRVEITVEHPETWEYLKELYQELFGKCSICKDKRTKNTGAVKFHSVGMRKFLHDLGYRLDAKRDSKKIPWSIFRSPKSVVCSFLRGLFETDGGVEAGGKVVSFSTASKRLAQEVQILLLNLGITSKVRPKTVKEKIYWTLTICGLRSRQTFCNLIGFDSNKKLDPLKKSLSSKREGGDAESLPNQKGWSIRMLQSVPCFTGNQHTPNRKWRRSELRKVFGNIIKPSSIENITYDRIAKVLPVAKKLKVEDKIIDHFSNLFCLDYFYDPVTEIEEGVEKVYDLNVPEGESFVANGMVNHNTFLAAAIAAYETYRLIMKDNPQKYYGISPSAIIQIVSVATSREQAGLLYQDASGHFRKCGFFAKYTANNTMTYAKFQTPDDQATEGIYAENSSARASLKVTFSSCIAKGLRGPGNMVIILDEIAHFSGDGQSSAEKVYDSITPSIATFTHKDDQKNPIGPGEGRIISISSPLGKQGQFYKLFTKGFTKDGSKSMLCIQAPTWEVNPSLEIKELEKQYIKDPIVFFTEFGAEFSDRTRGWIENEPDLLACIDPELKPALVVPARRPHFIGIDLGLVGDGTAVAIGHLDDRKRVIVDLVDQIKAGEGDFAKSERLEFDDVADWIYKFSRKYYLAKGIFDQWAGIPFEQALAKRGLRQLQSEHMTKNLNSEIYRNFKDMMWDKALVLYDWPVETGERHCSYVKELLELQAEMQSKYVTIVEAPNIDGKHDDRSDALVRMVWLASQHLTSPKFLTGQTTGSIITAARGQMYQNEAAYRRAFTQLHRQGGSSPDRQRSRSSPKSVVGRGR
jgi:intein/homing endonuclease